MQKKSIQPGQKLALKLTTAERKFIVEELMCFDEIYEQLIVGTPADEPLMMTLDELDDFSGYIAAEANHCDDRKKQKRLDAVFGKAQKLLDTYTDEEPSQTISFDDTKRAKLISDQAVQVAEWAAQALVAAEQLRIKTKPLEHFSLAPAQRDVLLLVPGISKSIKNRLLKDNSSFTVAEVASMIMATAEDLPAGDAGKQVALMFVAKHLMDSLQDGILRLSEPRKSKTPKAKVKSARAKTATDTLFQFKITLLGSEPAIWRRIQIEDCTLDKLHGDIQTSMGWTNTHLHQFEIDGERYGDPSHEQHSEFLDWRGQFDPEDFDAAQVTRRMRESAEFQFMTDDDPAIPDDWLQRRITVDEAEAENMYDGVPFGSMNQEWLALKSQMIDGDEVWEFSSSEDSWGHLAGRAGVALVRNGKTINCIVTIMN